MATGGSDSDTEADNTVNKLTCPICLEKYRRPKLLPCFHTFCQSCLQGLAGSAPSLACPSCRSPVLLPPGGVRDLQTNFYIEEDLSSPTASPQPQLCDVCTEDMEASHTCLQCQQRFCLPCRKYHDAFKLSSGHTVVSLTPEDTDGCGKGAASPVKLMDESKQMCPKHPDQRLLLHCKQCQADICMQCKLTRHDGHPTDDLVDIQAEARTSLQDMLRDVTQQRRQIHHLILALNDRCTKLEEQQQETEQECQERADTLCQWVKQSLDDMVTSIQTTTKEMGKLLQDQVEQLKNKDLALQARQDHLARALKEDRNTDIVSLEAQLSYSLLPSTDFKEIEKELAANIPKLHVKHSTSTVNQMQLREFVGVLQPVPPPSFQPLQPSSVAVHTDSTDRKSSSKSPADVSQKKPPTEFQYSKNPQSSIIAMCPISQNRLWVMYTPADAAVPLLKLFDASGQVLATMTNVRKSSGLLTIDNDVILSWVQGSKDIQMITPDGKMSNHKIGIGIAYHVSSARNNNQYIRMSDTNALYHVQFSHTDQLTYSKAGAALCTLTLYSSSPGHVSSKDEYLAFVSDGQVQVHSTAITHKSGLFSKYNPEKKAPIHLRFCQVDGQEQLLVLVRGDNRVHVVDHTDGGAFVRYLDTGPLTLSGLQYLATDFDQHVWIGCKGGKVVMVDL